MDLTLLKYLTSRSEASVAESLLIFLMTVVSWSGSVFGDWFEEQFVFNLFCLSCIQLFSNSRAASRASQSSSSRTSDSSSCVNYQVMRAKILPKPRWHTALQLGLSLT